MAEYQDMTKSLLLLLLSISQAVILAVMGCTPNQVDRLTDSAGQSSSIESVWIAKSDGSKQCATDTALPLEQTAQELAQSKIHVLESKKSSDGKIRVQLCGAPTGSQNYYRIPKSELSAAIGLGFKETQAP